MPADSRYSVGLARLRMCGLRLQIELLPGEQAPWLVLSKYAAESERHCRSYYAAYEEFGQQKHRQVRSGVAMLARHRSRLSTVSRTILVCSTLRLHHTPITEINSPADRNHCAADMSRVATTGRNPVQDSVASPADRMRALPARYTRSTAGAGIGFLYTAPGPCTGRGGRSYRAPSVAVRPAGPLGAEPIATVFRKGEPAATPAAPSDASTVPRGPGVRLDDGGSRSAEPYTCP